MDTEKDKRNNSSRASTDEINELSHWPYVVLMLFNVPIANFH
jgi:hypothetical protein